MNTMAEESVRIEASNAALIELRELLYEAVETVDLTEDTQVTSGSHGEPVLVAIIVALGGATVTKEIFRTVRAWMKHREALELIKIYRELGDTSNLMSLDEITDAAGAD
jgi:hypothetical protein